MAERFTGKKRCHCFGREWTWFQGVVMAPMIGLYHEPACPFEIAPISAKELGAEFRLLEANYNERNQRTPGGA